MAKTKDKPIVSVDALRPYVKRAVDDPELRDDLIAAFIAARSLYSEMAKSRGVRGKAEKVTERDFQRQLQDLVSDLSEATERIQGKEEKQGHKARNRVILLTGVTLGVLYNPWTGPSTREWIMQRIAGSNGDGFQEVSDEIAKGNADEAAVEEAAEEFTTT